LAIQSPAAETSNRDMEHHFTSGEGARASAGGWEILARSCRADIDTQRRFWNQSLREGLDFMSLWIYPR